MERIQVKMKRKFRTGTALAAFLVQAEAAGHDEPVGALAAGKDGTSHDANSMIRRLYFRMIVCSCCNHISRH